MSTIPTTITHEEAAAALLLQIRELTQAIEGFGFAAKGRRQKISTKASLPDAFLEAAAVACDASPELAAACGMTGAEIRAAIRFTIAFRNVAQELQLLGRGLEDTIAEKRAVAAGHALRAYDIAKRMNGPEERELLIPHLRTMERIIGRVRPGPKKAKTAPTPAPAPKPAPAPAPTPAPAPVPTPPRITNAAEPPKTPNGGER